MAHDDLEIEIYPSTIDDTHESILHGLDNVDKSPTTCQKHVTSLLDTYIKNTPFKQNDVYAIQEAVSDIADVKIPSYARSTMRKVLKKMRDDGRIKVFSKEKQIKDQLWYYVPAVSKSMSDEPEPSSEQSSKMPELSNSSTPVTHDGRVKQFFLDLLGTKIFDQWPRQ